MKTVMVFMFAMLIACPSVTFAADADGADSAKPAGSVKSSKSNSSERLGAPEGAAGDMEQPKAAKSGGKPKGGERPDSGSSDRSTVKSGKSNSSD